MTKKELIKFGFEPEECRVGTLYFKGNFFCRKRGNAFPGEYVIFHRSDDMSPLGTVRTTEEIVQIEKDYERASIKCLENAVREMKDDFEKKYGEKV